MKSFLAYLGSLIMKQILSFLVLKIFVQVYAYWNYQPETLPNEEKAKQEWRKLFVCTQPFNFEYQYLQNVFWTLYWNMLAINNIVQIYTYLCTSVLTWWYVKRKPLISKVCFCYWCMLSVSFLKLLSRHQNLWSVLPEGFRPVLNQNSALLCMVHCTA